MENLKELVEVISLNKTKKIELVGSSSGYSSKVRKLYEGLATGRIENEDQLLEHFYGKDKAKTGNLKRLKRRLVHRLLNSLLFIDVNQPEYNEYQKAYYNCYKDFAAFKILLGKGARKSAISIGEKILKSAGRFDFTELELMVLRDLRMIYGTLHGDRKKYQDLNARIQISLQKLLAEQSAEEYYTSLAINYVKSGATHTELEATAKQYERELNSVPSEFRTLRFILCAYAVFSMRYEIVNDYYNTLRVCKEALQHFEGRINVVPKVNITLFLLKIISCQVQLRDLNGAEETLAMCDKFIEKGTLNWYIVHEYQLLYYYHSGQYVQCLGVFMEAVNHAGFKKLPETHSERWSLHEAYIQFFITIGKIQPDFQTVEMMGRFRLSKFLNELPVFSQDKRGYNVSILIIHILYLLFQKRFDLVTTRLEALKAYSSRYLRKDETFRSNCFMHMLQQLPLGYFNKKAVDRKSAKYTERLKEVPLEVANQSAELELVPYEDLWQFILSSLKG